MCPHSGTLSNAHWRDNNYKTLVNGKSDMGKSLPKIYTISTKQKTLDLMTVAQSIK